MFIKGRSNACLGFVSTQIGESLGICKEDEDLIIKQDQLASAQGGEGKKCRRVLVGRKTNVHVTNHPTPSYSEGMVQTRWKESSKVERYFDGHNSTIDVLLGSSMAMVPFKYNTIVFKGPVRKYLLHEKGGSGNEPGRKWHFWHTIPVFL